MEQAQTTSSFGTYKQAIEDEISRTLSLIGPPSPLRKACEYALKIGGKRFRPIIAVLVAEALGHKAPVLPSALAVEFFHTASLVVDDLPCMDDDDERRNHPATHRKYNEATALLVSYALIAAGYELLAKNSTLLKSLGLPHSSQSDQICVTVLENAAYNTGLWGATGGQFMDIYPPDLDVETIRDVIHKKTVSLFEIAFVSGWAFGGGPLNKIEQVKKLASHYGMAFQIADDFDDLEQDKINGRKVNLAAILGKDGAKAMFDKETKGYRQLLKELGLETEPMIRLVRQIEEQVES